MLLIGELNEIGARVSNRDRKIYCFQRFIQYLLLILKRCDPDRKKGFLALPYNMREEADFSPI